MKKIFLWMLLGATAITSAQKKKLTLEESVLQQNRQFRADMMTGFQWIPDTDRYIYTTDGGRKIMSASAKDRVASEWLTLDDVNKALGEKANSFNGIVFRDASTFIITAGGDLYTYSVATKTGRRLLDLNDEMESTTPSPDYTRVAYTQKNNLFYADAAGKSTAVTNEKEGIVSGQTISRNEFGIEGGIFWSPKSTYLAFYQKDETGVADYPLLDINETPGKLVSIKYPMIGQTSEKVRVGIHHLASGKTIYISPRGAADDYMTNLSWTPD
ncbi:MAG TPA: DPP IV N-terminal domain-containing protein, partial [Flavobacterium sp.]|nr:DPP IV N-terminal domain-containing protein [Flavobacterium sp.]